MTRGWIWPVLLVALLVVGVGANLVLLVVATGDPSFAVERDYYRKGMEWDRTLAQRQADARLGWTLSCEVHGGTVEVALRGAAGAPVPGATVSLEGFHNARATQIVTAVLADAGEGTYRARAPIARPGLWELRFRAVRGNDVYTQTVAYEVLP
jgi:nitrogen fixation protein FixH